MNSANYSNKNENLEINDISNEKKIFKSKSKFVLIFNDEEEESDENEQNVININSIKKFKRRNRELKTKLQTVMNDLHNQFKNSILNISPIL
jgi:predicted NACHT family NTPase